MSSHPQLGIGANISEIAAGSQQIKTGNINDDRTTTLGVLSILNDQGASDSPRRLPVQQILDEQQSIASKRNSAIAIGDGLTKQHGPPGRNKAQVGGTHRNLDRNNVDNTASRKRLGQITTSKRQSNTSVHKKEGNEKSTASLPKFITDQKAQGAGSQNRQLRQAPNFTSEQPMMETKLPDTIL